MSTRIAAAFATGIGLYLVHAAVAIDARVDREYTGDNILTQVRVLGFPSHGENGTRFVATAVEDRRLPAKFRLVWREPRALPRGGDVWQLVIRLKRPRGAMNPGGFDSEAWLLRERIGGTGYVIDSPRNRLLATGEGGRLLALRQRLDQRISRVVTDQSAAAVLKAISIGTRHELSDDQWERYAVSGTSHLMAISGLHIGLAAIASYGLAMILMTLIRLRRRNHILALAVAVLVAGIYTLVSGAGIPAVRAFIMLAIGSIALLRTSATTGAAVWAAALLVVTTLDPLAAGNAGYVLSFGAVACLLWLGRHREVAVNGPVAYRLFWRLGPLLRMQAVLLLGLLPATVAIFDRFAPAAPAINLVAVPLFSVLVVPATLAGLILDGPLGALGDALLGLAAKAVGGLDDILAADVWPSGRAPGGLGIAGGISVLGAIAWAFLPRGWPGRWLSVPALMALLMWQPARPAAGCVSIAVLDVGQGQAIVVETATYTLVYDTGPAWPGGRSAAANTLLPYLAYRGIERIDTTVVSHADLDHAGGLAALAEAMPLGRLLAGESLEHLGFGAELCHGARPWQRDGIRFAFVSVRIGEQVGNDASCVLEISAGPYRALLTGDIERPVETLLVRRGVLRKASVVTMPHHGSQTSSSTAFVTAVDADVAIASAGWENRWGFPKQDIVERWTRHGTTVLSTSTYGAIGVEICQDGPSTPRLERTARRRIWHGP